MPAADTPLRPIAVAVALAWTVAPFATLALRASGAAWPFPALLPHDAAPTTVAPPSALVAPLLGGAALALATASLATPAAFALAWRIRRLPPARRTVAMLAAFLPVVIPPVTLGIGVQLVALRIGIAGRAAGVLLAHVVPALGYAVLALLAALRDDDGRAEEAARTLGARPSAVLRRVTLPRHARAIAFAATLAALVSWGQVATTQLVGEGAVRTLAVEVLSVVRSGDDRRAAWSALLLALPPLAALLVAGRRRSDA